MLATQQAHANWHLHALVQETADLADPMTARSASCANAVLSFALGSWFSDGNRSKQGLIHGQLGSVLWCDRRELGTPPNFDHINRKTMRWAISSSCRYHKANLFGHCLTWLPKCATGRLGRESDEEKESEEPCAIGASQEEQCPSCAGTKISWLRLSASARHAAAKHLPLPLSPKITKAKTRK